MNNREVEEGGVEKDFHSLCFGYLYFHSSSLFKFTENARDCDLPSRASIVPFGHKLHFWGTKLLIYGQNHDLKGRNPLE